MERATLPHAKWTLSCCTPSAITRQRASVDSKLLYTDRQLSVICMLFHGRTRASYVYNGCLAWYNVVLTPRIHSSVEYSQLGQTDNICGVSNQLSRTCPSDCILRLSERLRGISNTSYHIRHPCVHICTATVDNQQTKIQISPFIIMGFFVLKRAK